MTAGGFEGVSEAAGAGAQPAGAGVGAAPAPSVVLAGGVGLMPRRRTFHGPAEPPSAVVSRYAPVASR